MLIKILFISIFILCHAINIYANECETLNEIKNKNLLSRGTVFSDGYLEGINKKLTASQGPFKLKMSIIFGDSRDADFFSSGNYSVITSNISEFIKYNPDLIYKLKVDVLYCNVVEALPKSKPVLQKYNDNTPEKVNASVSSWIAMNWYAGSCDSIIEYSAFLTQMLIDYKQVIDDAEEEGFVINYYPSIKKKLLKAIILSDFTKMKDILKNESITLVSDSIMTLCLKSQ